MTSLGLITNPLSHANRRSTLIDEYSLTDKRILPAQPKTRQELIDAIRICAERGIGIIAINGGDGTVREVLSVLPDVYGGSGLPDVVILASGYTNVIAADVGTPGRGMEALGRVMAALADDAPSLKRVERPLLEIRRRCGSGQTLRGLFFGAAAFAQATRQVQLSRRYDRVAGAPNVAMFVVTSALRALLPGKHRALWLAGEPMTIKVDDKEVPQTHHHFLLLATTLHRLVLGLWPFWGHGTGPLRWLDIDAPPKHLLCGAPWVACGRPRRWMTAAGYRSGTAQRLTIDLAMPFVLDGELFAPGDAGIELSVGPTISFLAP